MNLPMDTDMNRYEKPVRTPVGIAGMTKPDLKSLLQRELTTAAEVGREQYDLTESSRCQETEVEAEGAVTDAIMNIRIDVVTVVYGLRPAAIQRRMLIRTGNRGRSSVPVEAGKCPNRWGN